MTDFVHLHVHSQYSFLDSSIRPKALVRRSAELGMPAVALTDHDAMFGAIDFYRAAREAGVRPILGYEPSVALRDATCPEDPSRYQVVLLARNQEGYRNLCKLNHFAWSHGRVHGHPRIDTERMAEHSEGLILLTGSLAGDVPQLLLRGEADEARARLRRYLDIFGRDDVFVEIQDHGIEEEREVNRRLVALAGEEGVPLLATNDVHYLDEDDRQAHEVLMAIQLGRVVDWDQPAERRPGGYHLASPGEMKRRFADLPDALRRTVDVAERCQVEIPMGVYHLPRYACPPGKTLADMLREEAASGLRGRLAEMPAGRGATPDEARYRERLDYELGVIIQMDFPGYFLIVADYVRWARDQGIPVGPGRGSGAGSLVAYSLRITDIDPMAYGLLFERFLNPERVSMPDFDVDFCQQRRGEVIDYAIGKYGAENVGQIITYGAMKARAVVRDVARGLGMTPQEGDRIAKLVPSDLGITLEKAHEKEPRLRQLMEDDIRYQRLFDVALNLEGLYRQAGIHASAVVIGDEPLWHYMPTTRGAGGELVTQYAMAETEQVGLVKFDFLGLKTLTVLDHAERLVRRHLDPDFDLAALSLDDPATYRLMTSGNTLGVFQLESSGFQELLRKLKPDCFEDVVAAVALYRPGPLASGMVEDFVKRKHGETQVRYPHPWLEEVLKETYGVIVYQEQVMRIASVLADFSLGQADLLRRAMGKKKKEAMAKMEAVFFEGARKKGVDPKVAREVYELMAYFAGYGFNKSHSAAYAVLTYQTGYLKAHYPAAFFAAMLTSESQRTEKVVRYVSEARRMGIEVLPPSCNASEQDFTLSERGIRFGLGAVRGVGDAAIEGILRSRSDSGPFRNLADFCGRVDHRKVNKRAAEALVGCGAFDGVGVDRDVLLHNLGRAFDSGARHQEDLARGQFNLFGADDTSGAGSLDITYEEPPERMSRRELLRLEKESLGFYVSGHPLQGHEEEIAELGAWTTAMVEDRGEDGEETRLCGVIAELRERRARSGGRMAICQIEDLQGRMEVVVFPRSFERMEAHLHTDLPVVVKGRIRVEQSEGSRRVSVSADEILPLWAFRVSQAKSVTLELPTPPPHGLSVAAFAARLSKLIETHPGDVPVYLSLWVPEAGRIALEAQSSRVSPTDEFLAAVRDLLPKPALVSSRPGPAA